MNLSFDLGYGNVKSVSDNGEKVSFPTLAKPIKRKLMQDLSNVKYLFSVNNKSYQVGEFANVGNIEREIIKKHQLDIEKLNIYLGTALHILSNDYVDKTDVNLAVGLPIDFYDEQKGRLESMLEGLEIKGTINNITKTFIIKKVVVFQQGLGAFYAMNFKIDGTLKSENEIDKDFYNYGGAILDIGFNTCDYARVVKQGRMFILSDSESGSIEGRGSTFAYDYTTRLINDDFGTNYSAVYLENILRNHNGILFLAGQEIDINNYFEEGYKALANEVELIISENWEDIYNFGGIYLTGGTASKIFPYLKLKNIKITLQNDFLYANANGYLSKLNIILNEEKNKKAKEITQN